MIKDTSLGFLYPDDQVSGRFAVSLSRLLLVANPISHVLDVRSGPDLAKGRNRLVESFLKETTDRLLFMVDSDMVFEPKAVLELHACYRSAMEGGVLGGFCLSGHGVPTLYTWKDEDFRDPEPRLIPAEKVVKVDGTGAACLLIPRSVLEAMDYGSWFSPVKTYSEDLSFCLRLKEAGVDLAVYTGAKFGHVKTRVLYP